MELLFANQDSVRFALDDSDLGTTLKKIYHHLSNVVVPFRPWDNPNYVDQFSYNDLVDRLAYFADRLQVPVDRLRCRDKDQKYFNYLHGIYEANYQGDPAWLDFHEHIHLCEIFHERKQAMHTFYVDNREKAGMLERDMCTEWLTNNQTQIHAGDIYIRWSELGKSPYTYWRDNEPNDVDRLCQLAKPWLKLRPKICVAMRDIDFLAPIKQEEFAVWWQNYHESWCRHWALPQWTVQQMFGVQVVGQVHDMTKLLKLLNDQIEPVKVVCS